MVDEKKYPLAGWLAIVNGIIMVLFNYLTLLLLIEFGNSDHFRMLKDPGAILLNLITSMASVYIFITFRKMLKECYGYFRSDKIILVYVLMHFYIVFLGIFIDGIIPESDLRSNIVYYSYFFFGVNSVILAISLIKLPNNLSHLKVPIISVLFLIGTGMITVCIFRSAIGILGLKLMPILYFLKGIIFLRKPPEVEFV